PLYEGARQSGARSDDLETLFVVVDDNRKSFAARHFALWRRDNQAIGIAHQESGQRIRRTFVIKELDVLADFHAALFGAYAHGDFTEGPDRSGRHGLGAQGLERGPSFLPDQDHSAAV